jgi:hypothetical protein
MVVDLKSVPTLSPLSLSSPSVFHQARRDQGDNRDKVFATLGIDTDVSSVAVYLPNLDVYPFSSQVGSYADQFSAQVIRPPNTCTRFAP